MLKQKMGEQTRQQGLEDYGTKLEMKGQHEQQYPPQPTTSISVSPHSFTDTSKARNILGASPRDLAGMDDYKGMTQRTGGLFGTGYGPGSSYEMKPEHQEYWQGMQQDARNILEGPGKVTQRVTGKGLQFSGQPTAVKPTEAQAPQMFGGQPTQAGGAGLPDASMYEENTVIDDGEGNQYRLTNGQWIRI